jgi:hypothetical protein
VLERSWVDVDGGVMLYWKDPAGAQAAIAEAEVKPNPWDDVVSLPSKRGNAA